LCFYEFFNCFYFCEEYHWNTKGDCTDSVHWFWL
jgi:hypothetical protein